MQVLMFVQQVLNPLIHLLRPLFLSKCCQFIQKTIFIHSCLIYICPWCEWYSCLSTYKWHDCVCRVYVVCKNGIVVNVYVYIWVVSVNMCVATWMGRGSPYDQPLAPCFMHQHALDLLCLCYSNVKTVHVYSFTCFQLFKNASPQQSRPQQPGIYQRHCLEL